jgi:hypothetical protein
MLGEVMVHMHVGNWVEGHDHRLINHVHLNFEGGLVEKDFLFTFINFHG